MTVKKIETLIQETLPPPAQKDALEFIHHFGPDVAFNDEGWCWQAIYQGEEVFHFRIGGFQNEPNWLAWSATGFDYSHVDVDEATKKIAWDHICTCGTCGEACAPGRQAVVFGRTFENCCTSSIMFVNPTGDALACVKKLVDIRLAHIANDD